MFYDIVLFTDLGGRIDHVKPLGAYRIASELRSNGYTVKVIDHISRIMSDGDLCTQLMDNLIGPNTLFVGWSSTFFGRSEKSGSHTQSYKGYLYPTGLDIFKFWNNYIKKIAPHVKIVYGGGHARPEVDIDNVIDYIVVGLADKVVVDLANHLRFNTPLKWKPSVDHSWKIIDYDTLGSSFDFTTSITKFEETDHIADGETLPLETSRGCMFKCKFCSYPLLGRKKTDPAYHILEDCLATEMKHNWDNFKVNRYIIVDDTFNETTEKLELFLRARDKAKVDLEVTAYLRLDLLHRYPEQFKLLKDMGMKATFFGIESLNDASASVIGKGMPSSRVKEMLYRVKDEFGQEFNTQIGMIVGLPHETYKTLEESMTWIYAEGSPVDYTNITPLYIGKNTLWNSEFFENYSKYGYIFDADGKWRSPNFTQDMASNLATQWHNIGMALGRQRMGNFRLFGLASYGYSLSDLRSILLKDANWEQYKKDSERFFNNYVNSILTYENINYRKL